MSRLLTNLGLGWGLVAIGALALGACGGRDQLFVTDGGGDVIVDDDGVGAGPIDDDGSGGFGAMGGDPSSGGFGGVGGPTSSVGGAPTTNVSSSSVGGAPTTSVSSSSVGGAPTTTSVGVGGMGGVGGDPSTSSVSVSSSSVGGGGGSNPIDCITCISNNCPQAVQCVTDPNCVQGIVCSVQNCLSGGNPDFVCVLNCFNGDLNTALLALQSVGCILNQCGNECNGTFGP